MFKQNLTLKFVLSLLTIWFVASNAHAELIDTQEQIITPLPDPLAAGWNGKKVCEELHKDKTQRVLRCSFPPGVGHEKHFHVAHFGYALSGGKMRIESESGIREVELKTGSSYTSNGTKWHQVVNIGDTTVRYLIVEKLESVP